MIKGPGEQSTQESQPRLQLFFQASFQLKGQKCANEDLVFKPSHTDLVIDFLQVLTAHRSSSGPRGAKMVFKARVFMAF